MDSNYPINRDIFRYSHKMSTYFLREVSAITSEISNEMRLKRSVTATHYRVLLNLFHEEAMSLTELSDIVGLALPNISTSAQELTDLGLVSKTDDQRDNRKYKVALTQKGIEFSELAVPRVNKLTDVMFSGVPCDPSLVAAFYIKVSENIDRELKK